VSFAQRAASLQPLDVQAISAGRELQGRLTKPPGALGLLEDVSVQLCGIAGTCPAPIPQRPAIAVFAGDHGVVRSGVTPWPSEVTGQMVANFVGGGAAINVIARHLGATVHVVDVGVASLLDSTLPIHHRRVRSGTDDLAHGPAMSIADAHAALDVGGSIADELVGGGADLLVTGDMGIGNTTPSAALIGCFAGRNAIDVTGRGTGIDDEHLARKQVIVQRVIDRNVGCAPIEVAADAGGLEIVALAGFIVGGVAHRVPVVVDGVIALAGLCIAEALVPGVVGGCIAGHRSTEPAATIALDHLGLTALLDVGMRLGEGSGAAAAVPLVQLAAKLLAEMATFDSAGVTDKT
jgi:nicotinate-nucleotide--dimethylbenzimidazole phosphoribosyltransferase